MIIEVLVGPIASGKTSLWSDRRARDGALIINDDSIVNAVHGGVYQQYSQDLKPLYKGIEHLIVTVGTTIDRDIVIDRPNLSASARARYVALAKSHDVPIVAVQFPFASSEEHARRRVASDARGYDYEYWVRVCNQHFKEYSPVSESEGFDNVVPLEVARQMVAAGSWGC